MLAVPAMAQTPRPFEDEVVYQIMPIAWRDSNNDTQGATQTRFGDFGGLSSPASLDYLQNLGVTMVYLQPVFPSAAYHGYQHGAGNQLNTRFGTQAQLQAFIDGAHARDMKVILDYVAYGVSTNSTYYSSAFNNPASTYDPWLAFTNTQNTNYQGYTYNTWNGSSVGFIHWNLANASAAATVINWARYWLDPNNDGNTSDGVDGFRLDHIYANAPEGWGANIAFWESFCSSLRTTKPGIFIFGEHGDWGSYGTEVMTPSGFDAVLTKPWEFAARDAVANETAAGLYSATANTVLATPAGKVVVAQTNDHDSDRIASYWGGSTAKQKVGAAVLMTQPFPPNIYYGDEIGMRGIKGNWGSDANDIPMREPFKWLAVHGAPMSNYWVLSTSAYNNRTSQNNDGRSVQEQTGVAGSVLETYRSLIAARRTSIALRRGSYVPVTNSSSRVWSFVRVHNDQKVLVAINLGSASVNATLNLSAFGVSAGSTTPVDLVTGATRPAITTANRGAYTVNLPGYSYAILNAALTYTPPPPPPADIDGRQIPTDFGAANLLATQTAPTSMGNNVAELNQLYVRPADDGLRIGITGNDPTDGTAVALFLETNPGGQNVINTGTLTPPPGGLLELTGLTLDSGFAPGTLFYINFAGGNIYTDQVALTSGGATKTYRGSGIVGSGVGTLGGGTNPNGLLVAMDNTNTAGITTSSVTGAATATTGLELRVPYADIGLPTDAAARAGRIVRIAATLVRTDGTLGNQWLPGCPSSTADLGTAPNMTTISGTQFASLTLPTPSACDPIDFNGDGLFPDTLDIDDFLSVFSGGPCSNAPSCGDIDFNNDGLFPDTADIDAMLSVFSGGACL
ncbi:MAG TPA: alpha-amylase family glycosyl hydrolase [Phycisphaerales bacterium]|nr:alpha-amylase family glycosyl hydrolase [Phycisphaerales bacterium]